jgi:thiamine pyrophosphate-dependent acetolactate synthase large subunit-like protein
MDPQRPEDTLANDPDSVERPMPSEPNGRVFGSDWAAEAIRSLGIPYVALNPGASFRGLHDSLVNHLGNQEPRMLLCLHEEHAVAIAHGWAKVTGRPMAAALHSNVGLMHATMAIYNAWADRVPMLVIGATGPVDAAKRRPWIDWLHTARDQGALVRNFVKWDDQPASAPATVEALLRAYQIATTAPFGPTYINLDSGMQEAEVTAVPAITVERYRAPASPLPDRAAIRAAADALQRAARPVILAGRVSRDPAAWAARVRLAERLGAAVLTDLKVAAAFPSRHPLHVADAGMFPGASGIAALRKADLVLSLDWVDLGGTLSSTNATAATVIQASLDRLLHNGWSMDHQALPPVDFPLLCAPEAAVDALLKELGEGSRTPWLAASSSPPSASTDGVLRVQDVAIVLRNILAGQESCLVRYPLSWSGAFWEIDHPLDMLGYDGGGGIGSGPGMLVGAALALRGSGRVPLGILGDGDTMMGVTAFWTAARYGIPLLAVIANNRSFFNDEIHQERVAEMRGRNPANKWVGQHIRGPDIDIAAIARAQGCVGFGPVTDLATLESVLRQALDAVLAGRPVVVDVQVAPGYGAAMQAALTSGKTATPGS